MERPFITRLCKIGNCWRGPTIPNILNATYVVTSKYHHN